MSFADTTLTVRPYRPLPSDDRDAIAALIQAAWTSELRLTLNFHIGDLFWRLRNEEYAADLWLWETDSGDLAGFAEFNQSAGSLEHQIHPRFAETDLSWHILAWAEEKVKSPSSLSSLTTLAAEDDEILRAALDGKGYVRQSTYLNQHVRYLDDSLVETPVLPAGFTVRPLADGEEEVNKRVQGHRAGWQSTKLTIAHYERLMQMPGYRRDLDCVVVAPDGAFVATTNGWFDEQSKSGYFEPVSTHPSYRRLGLGHALMCYGMAQLRDLGAQSAWVCSLSKNPASTALYVSCGMTIARRDYGYARTLS